jgi:hypothetical protein
MKLPMFSGDTIARHQHLPSLEKKAPFALPKVANGGLLRKFRIDCNAPTTVAIFP